MRVWKTREDQKFKLLTVVFDNYPPLSFAFPFLPEGELNTEEIKIKSIELSLDDYDLNEDNQIVISKFDEEPALD